MAVSISLSVWESNVNITNNTSVVNAVAYVTTTGESWNGYSPSGIMYIDGVAYGFSHPFWKNTTTEIASFSRTITHNADGSATIGCTVSFDTGISAGNIQASKRITLTTIPRAATINHIDWSNVESSFCANFNAPSSSFNYKLRVSIPYVKAIATYDNYVSDKSYSFTQAQKNEIYKYMVDNKLSNVSIGFVVETWNGSSKIGESSEPTRTVTKDAVSTFTTDKNSYNVGDTVNISITKSNAKYTHKLKHVLGNTTLSTTTPSVSEAYTGVTLAAFGKEFPDNARGLLKLVLETYYDSVRVGVVSKNITFNMANYSLTKPTVNATLVNDNATVKSWGIYLQNYSKYTVTLSGANGYYSSEITEYNVNGKGSSTNSYTSGVVTKAGTNTISCYVKDSRGKFSPTATKTINVVKYDRPAIWGLQVQRHNGTSVSDEGNQVQVKANFSFASCDGKNTATCTVYIKEENGSTWTNLGLLASGTAKVFSGVKLDMSKVYVVRTKIQDAVGEIAQISTVVPTANAIIDVLKGGNGVAIGRMASKVNTFEVEYKSVFNDVVVMSKGSYVASLHSGAGQQGYINVAQIKINGEYVNAPIELKFSNRGRVVTNTLYILFHNTSSFDPDLNKFVYSGADFDAYIVKSDVSTWDVYVKKTEAYDAIGILDYKIDLPYMAKVDVGWKDIFIAEIPADAVHASPAPLNVSNLNVTNSLVAYKNVNVGGNLTAASLMDSQNRHAIMDYGTTNAGEGSWSWYKFSNGLAICWMQLVVTNTWRAWGNLTERWVCDPIAYPAGLFVTNPSFSASVAYADSQSAMVQYNNQGSSTKCPSVYAVRPQGHTGTDSMRSTLLAIGRWK